MHHLYRLKEKIRPSDQKNVQQNTYSNENRFIQQKQYPDEPKYYQSAERQPFSDKTNIQYPGASMTFGKPTQDDNYQKQTLPTEGESIDELPINLRNGVKRLEKKLKERGYLTEEDLFLIKMKLTLETLTEQTKQRKQDLTGLSLNIEKAIEEASLALELSLFRDQARAKRCLKRLGNLLAKLDPQKSILLSYKLFKIYIKQENIKNPETQNKIADKCHKLFIPYTKMMELKDIHTIESVHKKVTNFVTYRKVKKFLYKPEIAQILLQQGDQIKDLTFRKNFSDFLRKHVSFKDAIASLPYKTRTVMFGDIKKLPVIQPPITGIDPEREMENMQMENQEMDRVSGFERRPRMENAMTIELDEKNNIMNNIAQRNYFQETSNTKGQDRYSSFPKSSGIRKIEEGNDSGKDSSAEQSFGSDPGTDDELMKDPDLYAKKNPSMETPNLLHVSSHEPYTCSKFKTESQPQLPTVGMGGAGMGTGAGPLSSFYDQVHSSQPMNRLPTRKLSFARQGMPVMRESAQTSDDLHLRHEPMTVYRQPEIVRVNSSSHLPQMERQQPHEVEEDKPMERSSERKQSLVQRKLTRSTTMKEIALQKVLRIAKDQTSPWDTIINNNSIRIQKIKHEDSDVLLLRADTTLDGYNVEEVFAQIYNVEKRATWDTVTCGLRVVERLTETSAVIYFYVKTPFGITERDFVQRRTLARDFPEKGCITMSFESCEHPDAPVLKKRIRGETHIAGYIIQPSRTRPNATDLCIISQVDIKGSIPKTIVNMVAGKAPADWVKKLKKAIDAQK